MKGISVIAVSLALALPCPADACGGDVSINGEGCHLPCRKPGFLISPYGKHPVLDIRGLPRGTKVRDPFTSCIIFIPLDPEDHNGIPIPNEPPKRRQHR